MSKKELIKHNLEHIHQEIARHIDKTNRKAKDVSLMCASKKASFQDVLYAIESGETLFGENYLQTGLPKIHAIHNHYSSTNDATEERDNNPVQFCFIGHLQSNKVGKTIESFQRIDSVDSVSLASFIARKFENCKETNQSDSLPLHLRKKRYPILLEVRTAKDPTKFGVFPQILPFIIEPLLSYSSIEIQGFMTMATNTKEEKEIRRCFSLLRTTRDDMENKFGSKFPVLSMGMTNDYPYAILEGSTLLRIGSAIFGGTL